MNKIKAAYNFVEIKKIETMKLKIKFTAIVLLISASVVFGQESNTKKEIKYKHSLGASFFMLGNLLADSPDYYLLTYGNRLTKNDRVFAEFNTWKYSEPLGTYGKSDEFYPGYVRASGIGVGYQRFYWKGIFTSVQATSFLKKYYDSKDNEIQKGLQLYLQLVVGYRLEFFKKRWYIEPAYALKYWPIDTNYPADFLRIENGKPKYIFEPSLNFGFKF